MSEIFICFLAGCLATLSPCVLPVLPLVVGSALHSSKLGALSLALGLTSSFTLIGVSFAAIGEVAGLDQGFLRPVVGTIFVALGAVFLSTRLQSALARLLAPFAAGADRSLGRIEGRGPVSQFAIGALLGAVWIPCSGPALGAAITLATKDGGMLPAGSRMFAFGLGASTPVLLIACCSREAFMRSRAKLVSGAELGKKILGITLAVVGLSILTDLDKRLEALFVEHSPAWLIDLVTRY